MAELWAQMASAMASLMVVYVYGMFQDYFPNHLRGFVERYGNKLLSFVYPYIQITFHEYGDDHFKQSEVYRDIRSYLSAGPSSTRAKRLKAHDLRDSRTLVLTMDDNEEIAEEFQGVKLWWSSRKYDSRKAPSYWDYRSTDEKRFYKLTFHKRNKDLILGSYLKHVVQEGKAIAIRNRQLKLYTNSSGENWFRSKAKWNHVAFEHPATFKTLAMDPKLKGEIISDLDKFRNGKDYYAQIGKAWKRGYLLYGPPGTGKSSMIAAMANYLEYDIYDLELTAVKENADLRKLLIDISNKSIIVIEDIDCSHDLSGQRRMKNEKEKDEEDEGKDPISKKKDEEENKKSKLTLSGLLNCIDGIWSACGGERIVVFTTNYVDKLDPALIRRGRMDKHIELSYCRFEAFKVFAKNYLYVDSHRLFAKVKCLLGEVDMTPADVAENLMPKSATEDADTCLNNLIEALEMAKEEAKKKAEEEEAKSKMEEKKMKAKKEEEEENQKADVKCNGAIANEVEENAFIGT